MKYEHAMRDCFFGVLFLSEEQDVHFVRFVIAWGSIHS